MIAVHILIIIINYIIACSLTGKNFFAILKNMLPSYFVDLGTQSSFLTAPTTSACMQKNGINRSLADFVSFICANFHMPVVLATDLTATIIVMYI